ncbi:substrate-binding domain-containing protein [Oceanospirillum sediminis]|uniref:Substrate-binding domain-containing protein n=1 Tax=Oceanospirillum sediminis TaxID=2760088 RepID=A0A839IIS2_9GAMM|nr:substrate-binding domain-containing protein [Oceanospirillum sediminis]MBB1485233.1 substrate-binding domain-containing protein [Oceanospirillum sediminis]
MRILSLMLLFLLPLTLPVFAAQPAVVAFAQDTLANDFRKHQVLEARKTAADYPEIRFIYSDARGRTSLLINQIETYIKQQVDVLIIGTNDAQAVVPVVEKAHQAGIKVIILDRGVNTDQYTTFIHSDNTAIGHLAGRYIADQLQGKGKVLLLEGIQSADVTHQRTRGFMTAMSYYPEIQVIKRTGNFLRKDALRVTEKLLNDGIEVDAIFSESDSMLSGVRAVLYKHHISPSSIITVGCDYISEAKAAILKGEQTASVYFPLGGKAAIDAALRIIRGQPVAHKYLIGADLLVTRDNAPDIAPVF